MPNTTSNKGKKGSSAGKPRPTRVLVNRSIRQSSELEAFNNATGQTTGVKEVVLHMEDFFDLDDGGWLSVSYEPTSLPGYQDGSSVRVLHATVDLLQPETSAAELPSVSLRNYMVLSGVRMTGGTVGSDAVLCAGTQTSLLPSNSPQWRRVVDVNHDALVHQGYNSTVVSGGVEVARLSVLDPDSGVAAGAVALQCRVGVRYAVSFPVSGVASVALSPCPGVVATPDSGTFASTAVFASVQKLQAKQ